MPRVLFVAHNHPSVRPGGLEVYAEELFRSLQGRAGWEASFVTRTGPPHAPETARGEPWFSVADGDPNLLFLHTHPRQFDRLRQTARRKDIYTRRWRELLRELRPDVVHFHHFTFLGYDLLHETRHALPDSTIVFTLHEFVSICHHMGQMVRTESLELCDAASPSRCHGCFPQVSPQAFFRRQHFIKAALAQVDVFIAPSRHLGERYVEWGIPEERVVLEPYGRAAVTRLPDPPDAGRRRRIAFFGRLSELKGILVLLEAVMILRRQGVDVELRLHGSSLDMERAEVRERTHALLQAAGASVRFVGRYEPAELPSLMSDADWVVVPSVWWENSPLVIAEALAHQRPVICSDVGGMAALVRDGETGLHFRRGDPHSLAATIVRAIGDPELWDSLCERIADEPAHTMDDHVETLRDLYANAKVPRPLRQRQGAAPSTPKPRA